MSSIAFGGGGGDGGFLIQAQQPRSPCQPFRTPHPSVFEGKLIDELAMVNLAQSLKPESIPPLVQLKVQSESEAVSGVDFFEPSAFTAGERLAESPCAIARIIRGKAYRRTMKVSAAGSSEIKNRPLKFSWVLLRGDSDKVTITPSEDGSEAEISTLRTKVAIVIRERNAPEVVRVALTNTRNNPHFFSKNEAAIRSLAKGSAVAATLRRFQSTGVKPFGDLPPNDLYHLSQFHTDILSACRSGRKAKGIL